MGAEISERTVWGYVQKWERPDLMKVLRQHLVNRLTNDGGISRLAVLRTSGRCQMAGNQRSPPIHCHILANQLRQLISRCAQQWVHSTMTTIESTRAVVA